MSRLHFGNSEYKHLIGKKIGGLTILNIEDSPDEAYINTDGYFGNAYLITLSNLETLHFRYFEEVVAIYGELELNENKNNNSLK